MYHLWKHVKGHNVLVFVTLMSEIAIFYEGYNQGVMGGVNVSPNYIETMNIGHGSTVTKPTKQGGLVAAYYFGAMCGCFMGGYTADKVGRIKGSFIGACWAILGAALQAGAINSNMFICARVISGLGIGFVNTITPAWAAELAQAHNRGSFLCLIFMANYVGIAVAYWLAFGLSFVDNGQGPFRWRFLLSVQAIPVLLLAIFIWFLPESPRWLIAQGRESEAKEILNIIREGKAEDEFKEIVEVVKSSEANADKFAYYNMVIGRKSGMLHLGRRALLSMSLQLMMEWDGITTITVYAPTIFEQAGFSTIKANWLSSLLNSVGILGTLVASFLIDRYGRRKLLINGAAILSVCLFLVGGFDRLIQTQPENAAKYGIASAVFIFLYDFFYSSTWLMIPFIYPTEIFPTEVRAKGNAFGVFGWALGVGWNSLLNPVMFNSISYGTFFLYGCTNLIWIPVVYAFYPETARRSLESTNVLFASKSPFTWKEEQAFAEMTSCEPMSGSQEKSNETRLEDA